MWMCYTRCKGCHISKTKCFCNQSWPVFFWPYLKPEFFHLYYTKLMSGQDWIDGIWKDHYDQPLQCGCEIFQISQLNSRICDVLLKFLFFVIGFFLQFRPWNYHIRLYNNLSWKHAHIVHNFSRGLTIVLILEWSDESTFNLLTYIDDGICFVMFLF